MPNCISITVVPACDSHRKGTCGKNIYNRRQEFYLDEEENINAAV